MRILGRYIIKSFLMLCIVTSLCFAEKIEIESARTEKTKLFDNKDGTYTIQASISPMHYKEDRDDSKEKWKDIDTTIQADMRVEKAPYNAIFDKNYPRFVIFHKKGGYLSEEFTNDKEESIPNMGKVEGNKIIYENVMPNIDVEIVAMATGVKQNIILKTPEALMNQWKIKYSSDKSRTVVGERKVKFDKIIDETRAYNKDGQEIELSYKLRSTHMEIAPINIASTEFPIVIDPFTISEEQVSAGTDDALQENAASGNDMFLTNSYNYLKNAGGLNIGPWGGFRFQSVPIPNGATITSASITIYPTENVDDVHALIYCEDGDGATFTTDDANISSRSMTSTSVAWYEANLAYTWEESPDISTVVQEVVDGSWSNNDDLVIIFFQDNTNEIQIFAYEQGGAGAFAAKFNCTYEPPATNTKKGYARPKLYGVK